MLVDKSYDKYIKYKRKYTQLKHELEGGSILESNLTIYYTLQTNTEYIIYDTYAILNYICVLYKLYNDIGDLVEVLDVVDAKIVASKSNKVAKLYLEYRVYISIQKKINDEIDKINEIIKLICLILTRLFNEYKQKIIKYDQYYKNINKKFIGDDVLLEYVKHQCIGTYNTCKQKIREIQEIKTNSIKYCVSGNEIIDKFNTANKILIEKSDTKKNSIYDLSCHNNFILPNFIYAGVTIRFFDRILYGKNEILSNGILYDYIIKKKNPKYYKNQIDSPQTNPAENENEYVVNTESSTIQKIITTYFTNVTVINPIPYSYIKNNFIKLYRTRTNTTDILTIINRSIPKDLNKFLNPISL